MIAVDKCLALKTTYNPWKAVHLGKGKFWLYKLLDPTSGSGWSKEQGVILKNKNINVSTKCCAGTSNAFDNLSFLKWNITVHKDLTN
jgi:hypothetical protein